VLDEGKTVSQVARDLDLTAPRFFASGWSALGLNAAACVPPRDRRARRRPAASNDFISSKISISADRTLLAGTRSGSTHQDLVEAASHYRAKTR
jgi:hypothetical protein